MHARNIYLIPLIEYGTPLVSFQPGLIVYGQSSVGGKRGSFRGGGGGGTKEKTTTTTTTIEGNDGFQSHTVRAAFLYTYIIIFSMSCMAALIDLVWVGSSNVTMCQILETENKILHIFVDG